MYSKWFKGYSIFWHAREDLNIFVGGTYHCKSNYFTSSPSPNILNFILLLGPPCAISLQHFELFNTPYLCIIIYFPVPPPHHQHLKIE